MPQGPFVVLQGRGCLSSHSRPFSAQVSRTVLLSVPTVYYPFIAISVLPQKATVLTARRLALIGLAVGITNVVIANTMGGNRGWKGEKGVEWSSLPPYLPPLQGRRVVDGTGGDPTDADNGFLPPPLRSAWSTYHQKREAVRTLKTSARRERALASLSKAPASTCCGTAVVTGAGRGIGREFCVILARYGYDVIGVVRSDSPALKKDVEAYGRKMRLVKGDVRGGLPEVKWAEVDVLVNNAGVGGSGPFLDTGDEEIDVNVKAVTDLTRSFLKAGGKRKGVIFLSSVTGCGHGLSGGAVYSSTKAYVSSLARGLNRELRGVRVTNVVPGATSTDFSRGVTGMAFKVPFYATPARKVAEDGLKAFLEGRDEVTVGFWNKCYVGIGAAGGNGLRRVADGMWGGKARGGKADGGDDPEGGGGLKAVALHADQAQLLLEAPLAPESGAEEVEAEAGSVGGDDRVVDEELGGGKEEETNDESRN